MVLLIWRSQFPIQQWSSARGQIIRWGFFFLKRINVRSQTVLAQHAGQKYSVQHSYCVVFKFSELEMDKHMLASSGWIVTMVTPGNSSNAILLLWPSMRMFQFGMGLLMQSYMLFFALTYWPPRSLSTPETELNQRESASSHLLEHENWGWGRHLQTKNGFLNPGSCGAELHSQESTVEAGDALMNQAALSQRKPTTLRCRHHNCVFLPLTASKTICPEANSFTWLLWSCFLFSQEAKMFSPLQSHRSFSSAFQRQTRSIFTTNCLRQWKRRKKTPSAVSCS